MPKKSSPIISHRISIVAAAIVSVIGFSHSVAFAQESASANNVERIHVTGSRLKRVDVEGASPVTIISSAELIKQGFSNVGDALRASNFNSFGAYSGGANNSWSSQSTVALKGSSVAHTLTLLDGNRMAKSPVLNGSAANLNTIPMAAVERIEILTDGASAIYGTDAIAGVINIILKKNYSGLEVEARADRPSMPGADSNRVSFTGGLNSDEGNVIFTWEHSREQGIQNADRDYSSAFVTDGKDPNYLQNWNNISWTGRTIIRASDGSWAGVAPIANKDCSAYNVNGETGFMGPLEDSSYPGEMYCAYDYTKSAGSYSGSDRDSALMHFTRNLTDDIELTARAYWAHNETTDRSAPAPHNIDIAQDMSGYTTPEGLELVPMYAGDKFSMRFNTSGDRIALFSDDVMDYLIALKGDTDDVSWDLTFNYNTYNSNTWGTGYLFGKGVTDLIGSYNEQSNKFEGWDPRDPNSEVPGGASANFDKKSNGTYMEVATGANMDIFSLPAGAVNVYVGASYREESFKSDVDALAAAGQILGGNGGPGGSGERQVTAVFTEALVPILDDLELNVAARYDDYSDFGSTLNPQISLHYTPLESLALRASWGTGFRAPTLNDLYSPGSTGYGDVTNYLQCYAEGESIEGCGRTVKSIPTTEGGFDGLNPEESKSFNVGMVWDVTDDLDLTVDYWGIEVDNLISSVGSSYMVKLLALAYQEADKAGSARPSLGDLFGGAEIELLANNRIQSIKKLTTNQGTEEREGLDVSVGYKLDTDVGLFRAKLAYSHFLKYQYSFIDSDTNALTLSSDVSGNIDYPTDRINLTLSHDIDGHSVTYYANYISGQDNRDTITGEVVNKVDSIVYHNISYNYSTPWNSTVSLGVNNVTNEGPRFESLNPAKYEGTLYGIKGRIYYAGYTQRF